MVKQRWETEEKHKFTNHQHKILDEIVGAQTKDDVSISECPELFARKVSLPGKTVEMCIFFPLSVF